MSRTRHDGHPARTVAMLAALVLVVTGMPYLYGWLAADPGNVYTGLMYDVSDHTQYWSWVTASRHGLFISNYRFRPPVQPIEDIRPDK